MIRRRRRADDRCGDRRAGRGVRASLWTRGRPAILRWIAGILTTVLVLGSLGVTGGYAWYLRSGTYRAACAARLSEKLSLPSEIGQVVPRSRRAREFRDVIVWLPQKRDQALVCRKAIVVLTPEESDPDAYELQLTGGACEISTRTWLTGDYRGVIESGLRPGFMPGGPRRVSFADMNITFERDTFKAVLADAAGVVSFEKSGSGAATLIAQEFNGVAMERPVLLTARISSAESGIRVDDLLLQTPVMPIAVAGLDALTGVPASSGTFAGRLTYAERGSGGPADRELTVSGICRDLELAEWTAAVQPRPWRGRCPEIELQELHVAAGRPQRLRFRGLLRELKLADLLATWGLDGVEGQVSLDVGAAELDAGGIRRFVASGECRGVSLEALTGAIGLGRMTGTLNVTIADLSIVDNRIQSMKAALIVEDAERPPNWIEGKLLVEAASRLLHVALPSILPQRIEYTKLGVRLEIRDEELYVFGTHGEREKTILTVLLYGQALPILREPESPFDLRPSLDALRGAAALRLMHILPAPPPAGRTATAPAPGQP